MRFAIKADGMSRHVFTAKDQRDADSIAARWVAYHRLRATDVSLSVAKEEERPMADEFMGAFRT